MSLRLAESERECQNALSSLQSLQQQIASGEIGVNKRQQGGDAARQQQSAEEELKTLQVVVANLREELVTTSDAARSEKQRLEATVREVTQQLGKEREQAARYKAELADRPSREDYLAVRKQLKMVTKIAFNVQDEDIEVSNCIVNSGKHDADLSYCLSQPDSLAQDPESTSAEGSKGTAGRDFAQLEALLAGRMKALETDLATTRRELGESRTQEVR